MCMLLLANPRGFPLGRHNLLKKVNRLPPTGCVVQEKGKQSKCPHSRICGGENDKWHQEGTTLAQKSERMDVWSDSASSVTMENNSSFSLRHNCQNDFKICCVLRTAMPR